MVAVRSSLSGTQAGGLVECSRGYHPRLRVRIETRPGWGGGDSNAIAQFPRPCRGACPFSCAVPGVLPPATFHHRSAMRSGQSMLVFSSGKIHKRG
jgi:hypothetical protein